MHRRRKAFSEIAESERARWMRIPITGCDGMPRTGQAWVRSGTLAATIFIRPNTDLALEMLVDAIQGGASLPERKVTEPESVPSLADLAASVRGTDGDKSHRSARV